MNNDALIIGFLIWAGKEIYQSFLGSRSKTLETVEKTKEKLIILEIELKNAALKIDELQRGIDFLKSEKREYRR